MSSGMRRFVLFALALAGSWLAGLYVEPTWTVERIALDAQRDEAGRLYYRLEGEPVPFDPVPVAESQLHAFRESGATGTPAVEEEFVSAVEIRDGRERTVYYQLAARFHFGYLSLLPALVAVMLCWLTREPVTALLGGIVSGALILGKYDLTGQVLIPSVATTSSASVLVLYLWLLGGLMGVWSRTGAAQAFAEFVTVRFVRGPRSAKLVAWVLGVVFFQGEP